jgi:hypothetical protein
MFSLDIAQTMVNDQVAGGGGELAAEEDLPIGSIFEGAMFVFFQITVFLLCSKLEEAELEEDAESTRTRHTNLEGIMFHSSTHWRDQSLCQETYCHYTSSYEGPLYSCTTHRPSEKRFSLPPLIKPTHEVKSLDSNIV